MTLAETFFNLEVLKHSMPLLLSGLWMTIRLAVTSILIGLPLGLAVCMTRLYAPKPFRLIAVAYIDVLRALPILVVLIVIYYALPFVGVRLSSFVAATLGLSIAMSAFSAEVLRSGMSAVSRGQIEAATALGLNFWAIVGFVVLPQAIRLVVPALTSNCIGLVKETSLASVVALSELLKQGNDAQALNANPTPLIAVALIYLTFLWPLVRLVDRSDAKANRSRANA